MLRLPGISSASFSPVTDALALLFDDGVLQVRHGDRLHLEVATGLFGIHGPRHAWSPDGSHILVADAVTTQVRDATTGTLISTWDALSGFFATSWSPDGGLVASGGEDGCTIWDPRTGRPRRCLTPEGVVTWTAWSPDAAVLATGILLADDDFEVAFWDTRTGRQLRILTEVHWGETALWTPDGTRILTHCEEGSYVQEIDTTSWEVRRGVEVRDFHSHTSPDWHPTGTVAATGGSDGTVNIWDLASGRRLHRIPAHDSDVHHVEFNADGSRLLSIADDDTAHIWTFGGCR
ncbi:WD40 repeat domain-containing protein [Arachnia propionica]|uniref:Uncharacterized protein n=1 Tax=Arachnia propionica TaxID=1750 RepID=A0A3P1WTS3_9ACTN|nr:hypothetical protein [Arachnia propionica]RRD49944.1 hypothetical protein EII35_06130 [Arachnia propionica]